MPEAAFGGTPFSTSVALWLDHNGQRLPLSHVGSDFIIFRTPLDLPACEAAVVVSVDGREHARRVTLPYGTSNTTTKTAVVPVDPPF